MWQEKQVTRTKSEMRGILRKQIASAHRNVVGRWRQKMSSERRRDFICLGIIVFAWLALWAPRLLGPLE